MNSEKIDESGTIDTKCLLLALSALLRWGTQFRSLYNRYRNSALYKCHWSCNGNESARPTEPKCQGMALFKSESLSVGDRDGQLLHQGVLVPVVG